MKKITAIFSVLCSLCWICGAQNPELQANEASEFTMIGKVFDDTPSPYQRVDTVKYKGFIPKENFQMRTSTGLAVAFRTDSPCLYIETVWGELYHGISTAVISHMGYDLYIRKDGRWQWAGNGGGDKPLVKIREGMDRSLKECLLYLPLYSEEHSIRLLTEKGSHIEPMENPFRHRILFNGSSYTHGVGTTRAGLSYPMIFERNTGLHVIDFATSGNCRMQEQMLRVMLDIDADAYVFDSFSNPSAKEINKRLLPFIDAMVKAHPGKPMIFQQTIIEARESFDLAYKAEKDEIRATADSLMKIACKKHKDVYFIPTDPTAEEYETTADGSHPDDYGYWLWERSIEKPVLRILRKYGIR